MDTEFTPEQEDIRRTLRELLHKRCHPDDLKAAVRTPPGYDEGLWRRLAGQLGLPGLALPAEYGGAGFGPTELTLACEETGRALLPSPLLGTALLAAPLVSALGTQAQRRALLPRFANGELTAAFAALAGLGLTGGGGPDWAGGGRAGGIQARRVGEQWRLYGQADQVLGGHSAGVLVAAAHVGGYARSCTRLFVVKGGAPGLVRRRLTVLDETRPQARVQLRDVPAEPLGGEDAGDPGPALTRTGVLVAAALAAEAVGTASAALASTVEYVRAREQFGRPIGSFQAVKHRLADLYVRVQAARSAAYYAAWEVGEVSEVPEGGEGGGAVSGRLALAQGLEALRAAAGEAIQLHGGIGFTWEHHAHLYFKRAAADELLFGPVNALRGHAAELAGLFKTGLFAAGAFEAGAFEGASAA